MGRQNFSNPLLKERFRNCELKIFQLLLKFRSTSIISIADIASQSGYSDMDEVKSEDN